MISEEILISEFKFCLRIFCISFCTNALGKSMKLIFSLSYQKIVWQTGLTMYLPNPLWRSRIQHNFFKWSLTGFNYEFSFS